MVCLGNICRSPMAEGLMRKKLEDHNINAYVDSCGFEPFHAGDAPDKRAIHTARLHNVDIAAHRGKLFKKTFFDEFDRIYVMDSNNYQNVAAMARNESDLRKVDFIMNMVNPGSNEPVPDPYYGGAEEFSHSWSLLDQATDKIIRSLKQS